MINLVGLIFFCTFANGELFHIPHSYKIAVMNQTLKLTNDVNDVTKLAEWIETIGEATMLPPDKVFQLNLALEEAVVNVMNYAYPGETGMPVNISVSEDSDKLVFVIDDEGIAFDPTQKEDPDITLSADERPIGGLGIMLVRQFMQDISYERRDGHNRLSLSMMK